MKKYFLILLFAVATIGFSGCSQSEDEIVDMPDNNNPEGSVTAEATWFALELTESESSGRSTHKEYDDDYERFEWFNKGTADERAIIENKESNRVLFFYSDFSYFGSGKLQKPSITTTSSNIYVAQRPAGALGMPTYALVVMNGDPARLDALDADLMAAGQSAVEMALNYLNKVDTDNPESLAMYEGFFTMSSTAYKGAETDDITVLATLNQEGPVFYETVEEAILPENLTTFNVERLLAKFTLIIKEGNQRFGTLGRPIIFEGPTKFNVRINYAPREGEVKDVMTGWKVNLVNWGMNGLEKNTYLVKTLTDDPLTTYPWGITENFYIGWNSPTLLRSYWGIDQNYYTGFYPDQYRQAFDASWVAPATTDNIYSDGYDAASGLTKDDYTLIYKPYSAYTDRTDNKYALENTFDVGVMANQDMNTQPWLRCGTHIILTAQLIFDEIDTDVDLVRGTGMDASGFLSGVSDKYFSNGLWWSEKALKEQAIATLMTNIYYNKKGEQIANVLNGGYVEYINSDEHVLHDEAPIADGNGNPLTHEELEVNADKYFELAPAFIKGGDGWVSLKKKDGVTLKARYVNKITNEITLGDISDEQLVSYIYRFTNLAKHYKEGRMYYAIAIRHNLDSPSFENDPVKNVATGDYGVVRNTWYRMTLTEVLRPGTPVDDPDQPIVPNPEPDQKSLGVEVEVIPWRTVDINVDQLH